MKVFNAKKIAILVFVILAQDVAISGQHLAHAGSISFFPTRVDLEPANNIKQVSVTNESDEPAFIQASVFDWPKEENVEKPSPATEIIAVPAVFDLEPGETQLIRLSFRNPESEASERAFRLQIMEVPKSVGLLPNTTVIAFRVVLPVFFSPPGAKPLPVWEVRHAAMSHPELLLSNQGSAHLNLKNLRLSPDANKHLVFESKDGGVVLAGNTKSWPLSSELAELKGVVTLHAETTSGPIKATIELPGS